MQNLFNKRNKLQLLYCILSVYLLLFTSPIICVALFYGQFLISFVNHFKSHQCQPTTGSFQSRQHLEECNITCSQM